MKFLMFLIISFVFVRIYSQTKFSGIVKNEHKELLIGANVYIKGTYDGTTTDTLGHFEFYGMVGDSSLLVVSYLGYKTFETALIKTKTNNPIEVILIENQNNVEAVVITAGSFAAGEKSRAVLLSAVEIATTASSDGDVYGALKTFPGVQKQGETGKIIVRGGDAGESKTYMDGMMVSSPYYSSMPDLPARGRFSPFMFNGVMFSTGGYSAEYGQALSSVLELKTPGLFDEDITSVSLMNVGASLSHTERNVNSAYSAELSYNNLYPYFLMAKHDLNWIEAPQSFGGNFYHRIEAGKTGLIKTDITYSNSSSKIDYSNFGNEYNVVGMKTSNLFFKTGYNSEIGKKWLIKFGLAYNTNSDNKNLNSDKLTEKLGTFHSRFGFVTYLNEHITLKFGGEVYTINSRFKYYVDSLLFNYKLNAGDILTSAFVETDISISKNTALRIGGRVEYLINAAKQNIAPRISLAQKVSDNSQFSIAWGKYYQMAAPAYLMYNSQIDFENATHYLLNYQYQKNHRAFRSEIYYKIYDNLVTFQPATTGEYQNLDNLGGGYARGIDLFWKDDRSIRNGTYWISYSYIDSKRKFKDYKNSVTPDFVSSHSISLVTKYWVQRINTQVCLSYNFNSGRPYNNPNTSRFMGEKTNSFHDFSGNLSYITSLFGYFTVVHLSVSNIPGIKNIYTYRYSKNPDSNGQYSSYPVSSMVQRTIILGAFISIK